MISKRPIINISMVLLIYFFFSKFLTFSRNKSCSNFFYFRLSPPPPTPRRLLLSMIHLLLPSLCLSTKQQPIRTMSTDSSLSSHCWVSSCEEHVKNAGDSNVIIVLPQQDWSCLSIPLLFVIIIIKL